MNRFRFPLSMLPLVLAFSALTPAGAHAQRPMRTPPLPESVRAERDIPYAGTEHARQRLDLYLPKAPQADKLPLVVFIHGGAWLAGDRSGGARQVLQFVESGDYIGASIGYRLSGDATWPAQIHDCKAAIRWLRAHAAEYGIDPDRIAVMGSSAGGHLAALLGTSGDVAAVEGDLGEHDDVSSRVACVVDYFGPADLLTMGDYPSQIDHNSADAPEARLLGGAVQEHKELAREASPVTHVTQDDPPFLILHGTNDMIVPFHQSVELDEKLRESQVESIFIYIEQGGHGFNAPEAEKRVQAFLDKHLRGVESDISSEPVQARTSRE